MNSCWKQMVLCKDLTTDSPPIMEHYPNPRILYPDQSITKRNDAKSNLCTSRFLRLRD